MAKIEKGLKARIREWIHGLPSAVNWSISTRARWEKLTPHIAIFVMDGMVLKTIQLPKGNHTAQFAPTGLIATSLFEDTAGADTRLYHDSTKYVGIGSPVERAILTWTDCQNVMDEEVPSLTSSVMLKYNEMVEVCKGKLLAPVHNWGLDLTENLSPLLGYYDHGQRLLRLQPDRFGRINVVWEISSIQQQTLRNLHDFTTLCFKIDEVVNVRAKQRNSELTMLHKVFKEWCAEVLNVGHIELGWSKVRYVHAKTVDVRRPVLTTSDTGSEEYLTYFARGAAERILIPQTDGILDLARNESYLIKTRGVFKLFVDGVTLLYSRERSYQEQQRNRGRWVPFDVPKVTWDDLEPKIPKPFPQQQNEVIDPALHFVALIPSTDPAFRFYALDASGNVWVYRVGSHDGRHWVRLQTPAEELVRQ